MTRVRADDYGQKRQWILDSAAALFAENGFESTTMIAVARACGTSKSHLYHYFPGKEDLLFAIVSAHIDLLTRELSAAVRRPAPAAERFEHFVATFVARAAESRSEHRVLMNDLKFLPDAQRDLIRGLESELVGLMIELLTEINPTLMAPVRVRAPYAMLLFGMLIWTLTWYRKDGPVSPAELATRISHLFVAGFADPGFRIAPSDGAGAI